MRIGEYVGKFGEYAGRALRYFGFGGAELRENYSHIGFEEVRMEESREALDVRDNGLCVLGENTSLGPEILDSVEASRGALLSKHAGLRIVYPDEREKS